MGPKFSEVFNPQLPLKYNWIGWILIKKNLDLYLNQGMLTWYSSPSKHTYCTLWTLRNHHILNDLKHIVNTALIDAWFVYYRIQWENVKGLNTSDAYCMNENKNINASQDYLCKLELFLIGPGLLGSVSSNFQLHEYSQNCRCRSHCSENILLK